MSIQSWEISSRTIEEEIADWSDVYWACTVVFWGIGDIVTTIIGHMFIAGVTEANPVLALLLSKQGILALFTVKIGFLSVFYGIWRVAPRPYRVGIPIGIATTGIGVTVWNSYLISSAI
ncbi:hypothetical protein [Salinarchaeum chitinilyticum]